MRVHALKIEPDMYYLSESGMKMSEFRKNDRAFMVGDILKLIYYDPGRTDENSKSLSPTLVWRTPPPPLYRKVSSVVHGGRYEIPEDYCIMDLVHHDGAYVEP